MKILVLDSSAVGQAVACRLVLAGYEVELCDPRARSAADLALQNLGGTGVREAKSPLLADLKPFEALSWHCENLAIASERHLDSAIRHGVVRQLPGPKGSWRKRANGIRQGAGYDRRIRHPGSGR